MSGIANMSATMYSSTSANIRSSATAKHEHQYPNVQFPNGYNSNLPAPHLYENEDYVYEHDQKNLRDYKDRIWLFNMNRLLRKLWIPLPKDYCSALWCVKDGLGFAGSVFTWMLILFGEIVFVIFVLIPFHNTTWSALNGVFSILCAFLGFVAHVRTMFTDPVSGILPFYYCISDYWS